MFKTIKTLIFLAKNYKELIDSEHNYAMTRINSTNREVLELRKIIQARTTVNLDFYPHSENYIIVVGHYRSKDYIETFKIGTKDIGEVIDLLRQMKQYGHIDIVDGPPNFKAVIEKGLQSF